MQTSSFQRGRGILKKDQHRNLAIGVRPPSDLTRLTNFAPSITGPDMPAGDNRGVRSTIVRVVCWHDFAVAADE